MRYFIFGASRVKNVSAISQPNNRFTAIRRSSAPACVFHSRQVITTNAGAIFVPSAIARPFRLCRVRMIPSKKIGGGDIASAKAITPLLASRGRGRFVRDKVAGQTQETGNVIFRIRFSPVTGYLIKLSPMFRRSFSSYSQSSDSGYITSGLPYCL